MTAPGIKESPCITAGALKYCNKTEEGKTGALLLPKV